MLTHQRHRNGIVSQPSVDPDLPKQAKKRKKRKKRKEIRVVLSTVVKSADVYGQSKEAVGIDVRRSCVCDEVSLMCADSDVRSSCVW